MFLTWLLTAALAIPPDGLAALLPVGSGKLEGLSVSWDGDVVVGVDNGTHAAFLLNVEDWSVQTLAPCTVRSVAWIGFADHYGELYAGCEDGTIHVWEWNPDAGTLSDILVDEAVFSLDVGVAVDGLWYSSVNGGDGGTLYALHEANPVELHSADPVSGAVDADGLYPLSLYTHTGFAEGVLLDDENTLVIHHTSNNLTTVQLATGSSAPSAPIGGISPVDITPSWSGGVYAVSSAGVMAEFVAGLWTTRIVGLDDPKAVIASLDPADAWVAVTGANVRVWKLDASGAVVGDIDTPWFASDPEPDQQNWIQDGVTSDGYLWGGGSAGNLHVATARPWVAPATVDASPTTGVIGDVISVAATFDQAGDWEIRRGGDRDRNGIVVASGTVDGASSIVADVVVDADWEEGTNLLYVFLEDSRGQVGHARTSVEVDTPPDPPVLRKGDLDFGDRTLVLSFDGIPDADLARYDVYVSVTPFEPGDFDTGGPVYDGTTRLQTPIAVISEPEARVTLNISPLTNDVKHYVAVRAVDQGGLVGPMSNLISNTPRPAYSAAELAGEKGGPRCATTPGAAGWLAVGLAALVGLRRRSTAPLVAVLAVGALASPAALAQDSGKKKGLERDLTKQRGDFELRYGGITLDDRDINKVYTDSQNNILQLEFGPQITRFAEVDVGMGFFQELAFKVDSAGRQSGERTMLTWWPAMSLDGSLRLHIVDEQIVVPYVRAGMDWVVWSEKYDRGGAKDVIRGDKFGVHYGLGGSLLLDIFDKKRASLLEAQTGINDTYLTFEWRKQQVDNRNMPWTAAKKTGLDFGATMFTVGLKLDY